MRADGRSVYQRHGGVRYATRVQLSVEERLLAQAGEGGAPALEREVAPRELGTSVTRHDLALAGRAEDARSGAARGEITPAGLREDQVAAAFAVLTVPTVMPWISLATQPVA